MNKSQILEFIQNADTPKTKRDVARNFGVKGSGPRVALKKIIKELERDGLIIRHKGGGYSMPKGLPAVAVIEVTEISIDGDTLAKPVEWNVEKQGDPPHIEIMPDKKGHPALIAGDRVLARFRRVDEGTYEARVIKRLDDEANQMTGMVKMHKAHASLEPVDKKERSSFIIDLDDLNGAEDNDLVMAEVQASHGRHNKKVRVVRVLGNRDDPKAISIISLSEAGLVETFPKDVLAAAEGLDVPDLKNREDLRDIPLVTIDGADARDFDDAVFAKKDGNGFHLIVAIADVAHYVRSGSPLDREAYRRGNSTYFPDRVVPMLPEALSNDLCSLRPRENRACLAVHMWIDDRGALTRYKFVRGLMRSEARLTYDQVQIAKDGNPDNLTAPLMEPVINPLYEAYAILDEARQRRGALDLDLPEKQILINDKGEMTGVALRTRYDSHKLIEEFMILANVAAAKALEDKNAPCIYRVHDKPSMDKLDNAREFVETFGLSLPKGQVTKPKQINYLLQQAAEMPYSHLISQTILRTQSQAVYAPQNIGHFGLALSKYAHFTSPIRRYADLIVHRSLIGAYGLGAGALDEGERARLDEIAQHISSTERVSMVAERSAVDRFTAAYLSDKVGAIFDGRITGVTRFGLFVELAESGADGLIPIRTLNGDFYVHDEKAHALIGRRTGVAFMLGARVQVELIEADGLTGSTLLALHKHEDGALVEGVDIPILSADARYSRSGRGPSKGGRKGGRGGGRDGFRKAPKNPDKKRKPQDKPASKKTTPKHKRKKIVKNNKNSKN